MSKLTELQILILGTLAEDGVRLVDIADYYKEHFNGKETEKGNVFTVSSSKIWLGDNANKNNPCASTTDKSVHAGKNSHINSTGDEQLLISTSDMKNNLSNSDSCAESDRVSSTNECLQIRDLCLLDDCDEETMILKLTSLDPWESCNLIKEFMNQHNVPQKEAVEATGLNQSHLSQHLNKGTPMKEHKRLLLYRWFVKIRKEVAKQYRTGMKRPRSDEFTVGEAEVKRGCSRNRFKWGKVSLNILNDAFKVQPNPLREARSSLAIRCNKAELKSRGLPEDLYGALAANFVTEMRVYNWFANRRKDDSFRCRLQKSCEVIKQLTVGEPKIQNTCSIGPMSFDNEHDNPSISSFVCNTSAHTKCGDVESGPKNSAGIKNIHQCSSKEEHLSTQRSISETDGNTNVLPCSGIQEGDEVSRIQRSSDRLGNKQSNENIRRTYATVSGHHTQTCSASTYHIPQVTVQTASNERPLRESNEEPLLSGTEDGPHQVHTNPIKTKYTSAMSPSKSLNRSSMESSVQNDVPAVHVTNALFPLDHDLEGADSENLIPQLHPYILAPVVGPGFGTLIKDLGGMNQASLMQLSSPSSLFLAAFPRFSAPDLIPVTVNGSGPQPSFLDQGRRLVGINAFSPLRPSFGLESQTGIRDTKSGHQERPNDNQSSMAAIPHSKSLTSNENQVVSTTAVSSTPCSDAASVVRSFDHTDSNFIMDIECNMDNKTYSPGQIGADECNESDSTVYCVSEIENLRKTVESI